jgi:hypothetical protein
VLVPFTWKVTGWLGEDLVANRDESGGPTQFYEVPA